MADFSNDTPGVMACPPSVFLGALAAGLFLHWLAPVQPFPLILSQSLGGAFCLAGITVGIWGGTTMRRAGTNARPGRPVTALVTGGPFRFSRNPLYLSLTALYLGVTLLFDAIWPLATLLPALAVVHWRIVLREEQFLESRFGDAYRAYKARVHRWL
ncbi:MAG TPA: isoprenylcysteine carboxylmethyltransferase family protein [Candidatus Sulfopaludibacter sp.]|nr:isoprenylcysteine carboxylmethyltransferase family protein [Candidatus Sulfopaludibacter sp.]